tara:strand:- start:1093 stop:1710 length:618 start_codon:yes stop_codon:yes gene_type:complete
MASGPKKSEFEATEAEKVQAKVAKAEKDYFNENYSPLLREMRDISLKENYGDFVAGRASADTQQQLAKPSLMATRSVDGQAEKVSAMMAMQTQAQAQGLGAQRQRQVGVLATARGQQADATTGLASAARIAQSDSLQSAARKQQLRDARTGAAFQMGGTLLAQGFQNLDQGAGFFGGEGDQPGSALDRKQGAGLRFGEALKGMYG